MISLKRSLLGVASLLIILILSSCGGGSTTTGSSSTPTTAPATTAPTALIKTSTVTISGKSTTILTDSKGMTLYYFTPDTASTSACTSGCANNWPPLLFSGSGAPTADSTLPGTLATISDTNGTQVTYNGHPLYTFKSDTAPGQTNGQGVGGKWFVATTDLAPMGASSAVIKTATTTVGGKSMTILTDSKGMTLYYFTPDTGTTIACTGSCAQNWPPLLFTGTGSPTAASTLSGTLATVSGANGTQVTYNGHPLYTFKNDTAPGQATGQGIGGKWFVATPDLAQNK